MSQRSECASDAANNSGDPTAGILTSMGPSRPSRRQGKPPGFPCFNEAEARASDAPLLTLGARSHHSVVETWPADAMSSQKLSSPCEPMSRLDGRVVLPSLRRSFSRDDPHKLLEPCQSRQQPAKSEFSLHLSLLPIAAMTGFSNQDIRISHLIVHVELNER
jgi:hypothetical protein